MLLTFSSVLSTCLPFLQFFDHILDHILNIDHIQNSQFYWTRYHQTMIWDIDVTVWEAPPQLDITSNEGSGP